MTIPEKMSGIVMTGHGGPGMLEWRDDLPAPVPGKTDVIARVAKRDTSANSCSNWTDGFWSRR